MHLTLVTLVTDEKNCFQESFKAIKTVGISKFVTSWQWVPGCRTSVLKKARPPHVLSWQRRIVTMY